jgi:hypothetical protein
VFFLRGPLIARLAGIGLALAFIPLAYIPNLIASENWASSRTQFAMGSLILILAFFALNGYWSLLRRPVPTALLFMLAIAGAISATLTVTRYIVAPQAIELAYVRFAVVGPGEAHSRNVYLIPPQMTDTPAPANGLDEFGRPSTWAKWTQHEIVADVRQDAFGSAVKTNVTVITPADATNLTLGPDTVLLDMRNLRDAR